MTNDESEDPNDIALALHDAHDSCDALDVLLAATPHLEDDGFSARVMQALPPPRTRLRGRIVGSACIVGIGIAALVLGPDNIMSGMMLSSGGSISIGATMLLVTTAASALWAAATA